MPQLPDGATIAVMGATRGQGAAVAAALASQGRFHVRALTRNAESAAAVALAVAPRTSVAVITDGTDAAGLAAAFAGAAGVYIMSTTTSGGGGRLDMATDEAMGRAAVAAAAATPGVAHVVLSSTCDAEVDSVFGGWAWGGAVREKNAGRVRAWRQGRKRGLEAHRTCCRTPPPPFLCFLLVYSSPRLPV